MERRVVQEAVTASRLQTRAGAAHPGVGDLGRLVEAARKPLAVTAAPAGCGKSALLRAFAAREGAVLIDLTACDGTFRGAVRMLCEALREVAPGARLAFASAYARAAERGDRTTSLARWFARYVDDAGVTIAIDALDRLGAEARAFADFVEALVRAARDAHVVIAARDDADLPVPRWFAGELIAMPLGADDVRDALRAAGAVHGSPVAAADAEANGDAAALQLACRARDVERVRALLRAHGLQLEDRGDVDAVDAALDLVTDDDHPVVMLLRATRESRLGRTDTSEAWFRQALARAETSDVAAEAAYRLGREIVRRERSDAVELLEPFANDEGLDLALRCAIGALLAEALLVAGRASEAVAAIDAALRHAERLDVPARAHLLTRASYVELYAGDRARAREYALAGASLAEEAQLYTVGAGSYSVLYNIAYEDAGPSESLVYLERLAECAVRTGNLDFHLYAIVAAYELHVERGDVAAIERLEHDLREFDLHYGAASALQSLLPSRALVTAWSGAFASAYDVLAPSGTQQHNDADREALRWAEIALYAAAAKLPDEAAGALRCFAEAFVRDGASTQHAVRGAVLASLAAHLTGVAPEWPCADVPSTGRLGALNRAVATVIARLRGEASAENLLDAFDDLRRHEFAGLAKLFAALPEAAG